MGLKRNNHKLMRDNLMRGKKQLSMTHVNHWRLKEKYGLSLKTADWMRKQLMNLRDK